VQKGEHACGDQPTHFSVPAPALPHLVGKLDALWRGLMQRTLTAGLRALAQALRLGVIALIAAVVVGAPLEVWADGAALFEQHCAGCHVNGGNIIRRGKTLKLAVLERQDLASVEAIAQIASEGIGQMSGYGSVLGENGSRDVAEFVWQQALAGWPRD
jgi:cytochrome c6